jgi:hypothetical protein
VEISTPNFRQSYEIMIYLPKFGAKISTQFRDTPSYTNKQHSNKQFLNKQYSKLQQKLPIISTCKFLILKLG